MTPATTPSRPSSPEGEELQTHSELGVGSRDCLLSSPNFWSQSASENLREPLRFRTPLTAMCRPGLHSESSQPNAEGRLAGSCTRTGHDGYSGIIVYVVTCAQGIGSILKQRNLFVEIFEKKKR